MPGAHQIRAQILATAHQITQLLVFLAGHPHQPQITGREQPREADRVALVGPGSDHPADARCGPGSRPPSRSPPPAPATPGHSRSGPPHTPPAMVTQLAQHVEHFDRSADNAARYGRGPNPRPVELRANARGVDRQPLAATGRHPIWSDSGTRMSARAPAREPPPIPWSQVLVVVVAVHNGGCAQIFRARPRSCARPNVSVRDIGNRRGGLGLLGDVLCCVPRAVVGMRVVRDWVLSFRVEGWDGRSG